MGCALSSPVELIRVQRHGNAFYRCAVAEMQGWRNSHEDAHEMRCDGKLAACFVLDGHGGSGASIYGAPALVEELTSSGSKMPDDERLNQGFHAVDERMREYFKKNPDQDSGTTVVGAMCEQQEDGTYTVKLLNCGDSRAVLARGPNEEEASCSNVKLRRPQHLELLGRDGIGNPEKLSINPVEESSSPSKKFAVIHETVDHKPDHPTEKARIEAAGGHVTAEDPPRLDGNLAVSRGLGDFEYKADSKLDHPEQKVSCVPDIYEISGVQPGCICIIGCDGVWDVLTAEFVANFVRDWIKKEPAADLGEIAADIVKQTLKRNSRDNVTIMIVHFVDGKDYEDYPDEMNNYEKFTNNSRDLDDEVLGQYNQFVKSTGFGPEALPCDTCSRWMKEMKQCPCKTKRYCSRQCQKKGWKVHKIDCPMSNTTSPSSTSRPRAAPTTGATPLP